MKHLSRVVWSEGMYLAPHHFQVQGQYFEDCIGFAVSSLWFQPGGVVGFELDAEALRNGSLSLLHGRGIFPDGLLFHMPESDPLPPVRNITELFPPARDSVTVLLAVPPQREDGLNCANPNDVNAIAKARFVSETTLLHDETTGKDEKPVQLGRKNIRLLLDTENPGDAITLPIARIRRDGSGHYIFDPRFVPPCVQIAASERIMNMLARLIEILQEKSATLSSGRRSGNRAGAEYSTREVATFWMLHAVNSALPPLRHMLLTKRGHPEELYQQMSQLAGALCTFSIESHPRTLPLYDHFNLDDCFSKLDDHIQRHLEMIVPTNCIQIPLRPTADYFYDGDVADQRCLNASRWVLAIRSSAIGEADLISRVPKLIKVCSKLFVPKLVSRALPGLPLTHLSIPPAALEARVDTQYFSISKGGPCWEHMVETRQVGVYVPGEDLPYAEVELYVVLDS